MWQATTPVSQNESGHALDVVADVVHNVVREDDEESDGGGRPTVVTPGARPRRGISPSSPIYARYAEAP